MKQLLVYSLAFTLLACHNKPKEKADIIVHHAKIYTVDSAFSIAEAMAVKDGKVLAVSSNTFILENYESPVIKNADGKFIFPGLIDAHCHFYAYGKGLHELDLTGTVSFNEVLQRTAAYAKARKSVPDDVKNEKENSEEWIIGRGWDQNDWDVKKFPDRKRLDSLFPNTPVILKRIDGHAALANAKALRLAGVTDRTKIEGGLIEGISRGRNDAWTEIPKLSACGDNCYYWEPTGILIDNAIPLVESKIPKLSLAQMEEALLKAQENCLAMGLTTIDDAGLEKSVVDAMDQLQKNNKLKMRVYAMLTPNEENMSYYLKHGSYKTNKLNVRSFKFYGDGALGSRGACLLNDYNDKKSWKGFLLSNDLYYKEAAHEMIDKFGFQMNTHCIGDSAARLMLNIYNAFIPGKADERWRIEHAQIVSKEDLKKFNRNIIPSVQPTHATSDMYWAEERLGKERMKTAYAYKDLLNACGKIALGTDFPVEDISPFKTFYAAVFRKDAKEFPEGGFQPENALSREETLKGMTIWAAYANFEEKEKGSIEPGKWADFVILDTDLMTCKERDVLNTKVMATFIGGEEVYKQKK